MAHHHSVATSQSNQDQGADQAAAQAAHQAQIESQKAGYRSQISTKNSEIAESTKKITEYQNEIQDMTNIAAALSDLMDRADQERSNCQSKYESNIQSEWKGRKYTDFHGNYEMADVSLEDYRGSIKGMRHEIENALRKKQVALLWEQDIVRNAQMLIASLQSLIASLI